MSRRGPGAPLALPRTKDGRAILSRADLDAYDHAPHRSGGRERYYCPIHGSDHQQSLSVDPHTGKYKCHTCGEGGTLREHWPDGGGAFKRAPAPSIVEIGKRELAARRRSDAERVERLAAEIPAAASSFLATFDTMAAALRAPDNAGAAYLRRRGLDSELAASFGVGYAAPNAWPGDRGRAAGRIVYPLADPLTGRVVSALGRLCADLQPTWPEDKRQQFKSLKQRKLFGCPAGIWPYANLAAARARCRALVFVEGPADVLALRARGPLPYDCEIVALTGTADVLPMAALTGVAGVVLALDADDGGVKASRKLRVDLALAGIAVESVRRGWLGLGDEKDPAELAALALRDEDAAADGFGCAFADVREACERLMMRQPWDDDSAGAVVRAMYDWLNDVAVQYPQPWPEIDDAWTDAIDRACEAYDWPALATAVAACEQGYYARFRTGNATGGARGV